MISPDCRHHSEEIPARLLGVLLSTLRQHLPTVLYVSAFLAESRILVGIVNDLLGFLALWTGARQTEAGARSESK